MFGLEQGARVVILIDPECQQGAKGIDHAPRPAQAEEGLPRQAGPGDNLGRWRRRVIEVGIVVSRH